MSEHISNIVEFEQIGNTTKNNIPIVRLVVDKLPSNLVPTDIFVETENGDAVIESWDNSEQKGVIKDLGWYYELTKR